MTLREPGARLPRRRENSLFPSFRASFVGYSALFWVSRLDFWPSVSPVHDYRDVMKTRCFRSFGASFVGCSALFWGSRVCFWRSVKPVHGYRDVVEIVVFAVSEQFRGLQSTLLGSRVYFWRSVNPVYGNRDVVEICCFRRFGVSFVGHSALF